MLSTVKIAGVASLLTIFGLGTANAADPLVPPAPAPNANTIQLKISGQVNRSILYGDNGNDDEIFYTDSDNSGTRFRFVASGRLNDDVTAGATIELQFESNSSTDIRFNANGGTGGTSSGATPVGERIGEVWLNSASMGKLSLGQGNTASNGTSETDLSGTGLAQYSLGGGGNEGLAFQAGGLVGSNFTNLDGGSRRDRIRYDTPTFAGFRLSASASQGGRNDVALRYANQFAGARIAASIGWQNASAVTGAAPAAATATVIPAVGAPTLGTNAVTNAAGVSDRISGSVSVLLDNGFNLTFAAANEDRDIGDDRKFFYGKVGFQTNSVSMYGRTSFSIDYYQGEDINTATSGTSTSYGFGAVQNLDPIGAQMYLSVRNHELDGGTDDVFAVFTGMRIKF